ncbi:probable glutamate receptor [Penaeus chinensis]|uniref:probable glutamate receptor n=1 Tax=Penaeus chinensis TaxID=139456 RepID=UPI001FB6C0DC|nr:probable glutamate receptor [Penaeus chinensis]
MALTGSHLRVAAGLWVPFVMFEDHEDGTFTTTGLLIDLMDIFASKLNFTYSVLKSVDGEWGRLHPNGSATGMIGMCQRKEADMALGPFSITYMRSQVIDYSVPLYIDSFGIFLPRPYRERDLTGFVKPFGWEVWATLLILLSTSMGLGAIINWLSVRWSLPGTRSLAQGGKTKPIFQPSWILKTLLMEPLSALPTSLTGRVFMGTWMVVSLILSSAYQGILTSLLAVPKVEVPVDSLQDLLDYGRMPWSVEYGTALHQLFGDAKSGFYKKIHDGSFLVTSSFEERERMKRERFAILCDFFSMKLIMSDDYGRTGECSYYIAKEVIWSASMAFVFQKDSAVAKHFNRWIVMMRESGLVDRYLQEATTNVTACMVPPGEEAGKGSSLVLSFLDLGGVFLFMFGGAALGIVLFVAEKISEKFHGSPK